MRALAILAVIALIGAVVWFVLGDQEAPAPQATAPAAEETTEPVEEAETAVEDAAEETGSAVEEAVEEAETAVEEATEEATTAVEELQEQATDAIQDAEERVNNAVQGALESVNEAVEDTTTAVEDAVTDAMDQEAPQGETTGSLAEALSVEGFDPVAVRQAIADSDLGAVQARLAEGLVVQAEENPDALQSVIEQLKELLGPE